MGKRSKNAGVDPVMEVTAAFGEVGDTVTIDPVVPATVAVLIEEVAASVVPAARAAGARKFGVEFGVRTRRDGSAALADGPDHGAFRVFLEWTAEG